MFQQLIASKCTRCSRELTDTISIACGIGPECRKRMGIDTDLIEKDKYLRELCNEANVLAFNEQYLKSFIAINAILILGYNKIYTAMEGAVKTLCKKKHNGKVRIPVISINFVRDEVRVYSPYVATAVSSWRSLGMRWNKEKRRYEIDRDSFQRKAFMEHLRNHYKGVMVTGPKGVFWPGVHETPLQHGDPGLENVFEQLSHFSEAV